MAANSKKQNNRLNIILAVAVPLLVMCCVLAVYGIRYDTNDDATLANLSAGAYGTGLHPVHLNIILSALMRPLYMLAGDVNWYVITQLLLSCLAIGAIFYCLMNRLGTKKGLALATALLIPFATNFFYAFQYSKTSTIMLTGGLLLIAENLGKFNKFTVMGILLSVRGSMTRWESFFAVGGIYAAILLTRFLYMDKKGKINAIITMAVFFAVIFAAEITDVLIYRANSGWKDYVAYNAARTEYSDYKVYLLKGENIFGDRVTDTEFALLDSWDFYDGERFTTEFINSLCEKVPGKSAVQTVKDTAYTFIHLLYGNGYRTAFAIALVAGLLLIRKNPRWLAYAGTVAVFGGLMLFLLYRGRFTRWVESGLLWAMITVIIFCIIDMAPQLFDRKYLVAVLLAAMCIISLPECISLVETAHYWQKTRVENNSAYDELSRRKENLYLLSCEHIDGAAGYDVWHPREDGYFSNIVALGGWLSQTPYRNRVLENYGINRPMVDSVDRDNVYFVGGNVHIIAQYASRQLEKPVSAVPVPGYNMAVYQLVSE